MVNHSIKLTMAAVFAVMLASSLLMISTYVIPVYEVPAKPNQSFFTLNKSVPLPQIVICSDGTVSPTDMPITRNGNVYLFTSDIANHSLEIQKDNIIIDGAGYSFKGYFEGSTTYGDQAIFLNDRINVTINNLHIDGFWNGIIGQNSSAISISSNRITGIASTAIELNSCSNTVITKNDVNVLGVAFKLSADHPNLSVNNTISENTLSNCLSGIEIQSGLRNYIIENRFSDVNIPIWIASNNTSVLKNYLINGINGIIIGGKTSYSNENFSGGSECTISGNKIVNFTESCLYFTIGTKNAIFNNTIANSKYGVSVNLGGDGDGSWIVQANTFYLNNFVNNIQDVLIASSANYSNCWDNGSKGNYWNSLGNIDNNKDGIGDTPYTIATNNTDRYPLMNAYGDMGLSESLSSQTFAIYLGASVGVSIVIMVSIAGLYKKRRRKKARRLID